MTAAVRILIADDHEVVRQGVRAVIERHGEWVVCAEATTGREAVAKALELRPDVVVLDISMPELNGLEATRQIRRALPARILVLSVHESEQLVTEILDAGAHGYVLKSDAGHTLVQAIQTLLQQQEFLSNRVHATATRPRRGAAGKPMRSLTPRQREVLQMLAEGKSNKEIGVALGVTTKTAETHRTQILAKLGLHSMSELVRYAIRSGIIQP